MKRMTRRLLWLVVLSVVVLSTIALRNILSARAKNAHEREQRAADYQSALLMYTQNLALGLTRKDVENYLRARRTIFVQRYDHSDLVKIGEEPSPWYCSEWVVYVEFVFTATEPRQRQLPSDSDVLKMIELTGNGEGCL